MRHGGQGPGDLADIIAAGDRALDELVALSAGSDEDLAALLAAGEDPDRAALAHLEGLDADQLHAMTASLNALAGDAMTRAYPTRPGARRAVEAALAVIREYLGDATDPDANEARAALAELEHLAASADVLLPLAVVAARLAVSVDTVRRLITEGRLDSVRLGYRTVRVSVDSLDRYRAALAGAGERS